MLSKVCVFAVIKNASINDSRLHNRFDAFSTAHTKTFQKDSIARRDVNGTSMRMLQTQKALMFLGIVFVLMRFQSFSTRTGVGGGGGLHWLIRYVGAFVLIDFQERFQIDAF